jgi:hypothetical protein
MFSVLLGAFMADEKPEYPGRAGQAPPPGGRPDSLLILGGLGLAALAVLCVAMVVLALLFLKAPHNVPTQTVTITNGLQPAATPAPSPGARHSSTNEQPGNLPVSQGLPAQVGHTLPRRSDPQAAPLPASPAALAAPIAPARPTEAPVARMPERVGLSAPMSQDAPLPNRLRLIHRSKPGPAAAVPAAIATAAPEPLGAVQENSPEAQRQPLSQAPETLLQARALPAATASGLRLSSPRVVSAARLGGYRALKGFLLVQADLEVANQGDQAMDLRALQVEAEDSDGLGYPANPDLLAAQALPGSLAPGAKAAWSVAFLVPEDASLARLHLDAAGQSADLDLAAAR